MHTTRHITSRLLVAATATLVAVTGAASAAVASAGTGTRSAHHATDLTGQHAERRVGAASTRPAYRATLRASKPLVVAGSGLVLTGKVRPVRKGTVVVVQKRVRSSAPWRREAVVHTDRLGAYRYRDHPHQLGHRTYRVVVPATKVARVGTSKPVGVTVATWRPLAGFAMRSATSTRTLSADMDGVAYPRSVGTTDGAAQGSADWNLPAACTRLRTRIGAGDAGDDGYVATIGLDALRRDGTDAALYAPKSFALTQGERRTFDVSHVFRLTFSWTSTVTDGTEPAVGAQAVLGDPMLLCSA